MPQDIIITPNRASASSDASIAFRDSSDSVITLRVINPGTISFDGTSGQLFSITDDLTGTIFSVNDISGIPSLEVNANGTVSIAEFSGNVGIGTSSPVNKLDVLGNASVNSLSASDFNGLAVSTGTNTFTLTRGSSTLVRSGAHGLTLTTTGATNVTLPTTGTLATTSQLPTVNNATLTMNVSGTGLSGSQTFTANQSSNATFTVTSNATSANTVSTVVARDASGNFSAGTITATLSGNATNVTGTVAVANGGTGATTAANARTNLGATTIGSNLFTLTNPGAIRFPRFNADNTVSSLTDSDFRTAIGAAATSHSHTITWTAGTTAGPTLSVQGGTAVAVPSASSTASGVITTAAQTIAGDKTFSGSVTASTFTETSSLIFKENINPLENALEKITQLTGVNYNRIGHDKTEAGLIAENVINVIPEIVTTNDSGNAHGIHYTKLTAYLIEAVKTLSEEIRELKKTAK